VGDDSIQQFAGCAAIEENISGRGGANILVRDKQIAIRIDDKPARSVQPRKCVFDGGAQEISGARIEALN
jgi:hypothetical protein